MFASEDMFGSDDDGGRVQSGAVPPPPDEPEEWSASDDSDDEVEISRGMVVTVTPPRVKEPVDDEDEEWTDDEEGSPVVPHDTRHDTIEPPHAHRAPPPAGSVFVPTMGVGSSTYDWDAPQGPPPSAVGVMADETPPAPPPQSNAAAVRKAQLERMREQEQRKRLERMGGAGQKIDPSPTLPETLTDT